MWLQRVSAVILLVSGGESLLAPRAARARARPLRAFGLPDFGNPLDKAAEALKDKMADDELGMSVVKLQVACRCKDRSIHSLLPSLQRLGAGADTSTNRGLGAFVSDAALALLRRRADWEASAGGCEFFREGREGDAEGAFNRIVLAEGAKFDRTENYIRAGDAGKATTAVVSVIACVYGDMRERIGENVAGSDAATHKALSELAAEATGEDVVVAAELMWCPDEPEEILGMSDLVESWPELLSL